MSLPVDLCTSAKLGLDWLEFAQVFPERLLFLTRTTSHYNTRCRLIMGAATFTGNNYNITS